MKKKTSSRSLSYKNFHKRRNDQKGRYSLAHFLENFKKMCHSISTLPVILSFMKFCVARTFWVERHLDFVLEVLQMVGSKFLCFLITVLQPFHVNKLWFGGWGRKRVWKGLGPKGGLNRSEGCIGATKGWPKGRVEGGREGAGASRGV